MINDKMKMAVKWLWKEHTLAKQELEKIRRGNTGNDNEAVSAVSAREVEYISELQEKIAVTEWLLDKMMERW